MEFSDSLKSDTDSTTNTASPSEEDKTDVTTIIGGYGPWQRNLFILLFLASISSSWQNLVITFMAPPGMNYWCTRAADSPVNATILEDGDSCYVGVIVNNSSVSDKVKCDQWAYNTTVYTSTIVNEWDLVCDRNWLVAFSISIYNVGYLIALPIFGQFSDSLGRRPALLISFIVNVSAGILDAFSTSFAMFAVLRFFTAMGQAGFYTLSFVLLIELVSPQYRPVIGIAINFGWCLAFTSLPAVAWFVQDWFWLQLAVTLPKILFIPIFWILPESPRWLLTRNKHEKFREVVTKAAAKNGKPENWVLQEIKKILQNTEQNESPHEEKKCGHGRIALLDLFIPGLWLHTLNLFYNWLVNSFVYFGLSYNVDNLAGNIYLNFFASGVIEFPAYACAILIVKRMGRRIPMIFGMCAGGLACGLIAAVPNTSNLFWIKIVLSLTGKFFITATFATVYVYSSEIFPTVVRSTGVGAGSTVSRIGSILAPFVTHINPSSNSSLHYLLYAALAISSGLFITYLPETNNEAFADTLEEAKLLTKKNKKAYLKCLKC